MGCPMCKDAVVDSSGKAAVVESSSLDFNHSIYFMLGGFATVLGITGRVMWRVVKLESEQRPTCPTSTLPDTHLQKS